MSNLIFWNVKTELDSFFKVYLRINIKSRWKKTIEVKGLTALYIWFRTNFHIKKSPEVPNCRFFITDKLWYKIISTSGLFLILKFPRNQIYKAVKSLTSMLSFQRNFRRYNGFFLDILMYQNIKKIEQIYPKVKKSLVML